VQTTSATEITCRVDETDKGMNEPAKMIAFLKTSEEAPCGDDTDNCAWTYKEPDAILTSRTLAFNPADLRWELTVVGVGFSGTPELWVGSKTQELLVPTDGLCATKIVFAITDVDDSQLAGMRLYFADGYPKNHDVITGDSSDLVMNPELLSFYPTEGSVAGSRLEVTAPGVGLNSEVDVVDATGASICESVTVEAYGLVVCITKAMEIDSEISLKTADGETHSWSNRAVPTTSTFTCPDVPEIYTAAYWQAYYEAEPFLITSEVFTQYKLDDHSFDFVAWFHAANADMSEEDVEEFMDMAMDSATYGTFNWGGYHLKQNEYLTQQDISDHMNEEDGVFNWDAYQAEELALLTPTTANVQQWVRVSWLQPAHLLSTESYLIELQAKDGTWQTHEDCDGATGDAIDSLACAVEQAALKAEPFLLEQDDVVFARISVLDATGAELAQSEANTEGAIIQTAPHKMNVPLRGAQTSDSQLHIAIEAPTLEQAGSVDITSYIL
jgi:hypothetical protein